MHSYPNTTVGEPGSMRSSYCLDLLYTGYTGMCDLYTYAWLRHLHVVQYTHSQHRSAEAWGALVLRTAEILIGAERRRAADPSPCQLTRSCCIRVSCIHVENWPCYSRVPTAHLWTMLIHRPWGWTIGRGPDPSQPGTPHPRSRFASDSADRGVDGRGGDSTAARLKHTSHKH